MGKRKNAADWRAFLRALRRTGNVRVAAREAGMDAGTAYDHRIKDEGFAARWDAALAKAKDRPSPHPSPASGRGSEELVARTTKHGTQLIRAAPGRWHAKAEAVFLAELRRTGCVRWAAVACGISTTALYKRRGNYPGFAASWAAAEAEAGLRIPALLSAATIAALDPEIDAADLPKVNIDQAIAICRLKGLGTPPKAGGEAARYGPREPTIEEVRDEIVGRLAAIRRHREKHGISPPDLDGEDL